MEESETFKDSLKYSIQVLQEQIGINFSDLISAKDEELKKVSCNENKKRMRDCVVNDTKNENTKFERKSFNPIKVLIFFAFGLFLVALRIVVCVITQNDDDD